MKARALPTTGQWGDQNNPRGTTELDKTALQLNADPKDQKWGGIRAGRASGEPAWAGTTGEEGGVSEVVKEEQGLEEHGGHFRPGKQITQNTASSRSGHRTSLCGVCLGRSAVVARLGRGRQWLGVCSGCKLNWPMTSGARASRQCGGGEGLVLLQAFFFFFFFNSMATSMRTGH